MSVTLLQLIGISVRDSDTMIATKTVNELSVKYLMLKNATKPNVDQSLVPEVALRCACPLRV